MHRILISCLLTTVLGACAYAVDPSAIFVTVDGVAGAPMRAFSGVGTHRSLNTLTPFPNTVRTEMRLAVFIGGPFLVAALAPKDPLGSPELNFFDFQAGQIVDQVTFDDPDFSHGLFMSPVRFQTRGGTGVQLVVGADGSYKIATSEMDIRPVYPSSFSGGVRVAAGDVNGDGDDDVICAPGPGAVLPIVFFDFLSNDLIGLLYPYGRTFKGGVYVAAGDLDGDGQTEIVTAPSGGMAPLVKIYDSHLNFIRSFNAYEASFKGGVRLSVADLDGDGKAEIITGNGPGRNPQIRAFDLAHGFLWSKSFMPTSSRAGIQVSAVSFLPVH